MSKPVIKAAEFDVKPTGLRPLKVVRFHDSIMLGTMLDLNSAVAFGQTVGGIPTEIYFYDATFMLLKFCGKTKDLQYMQLIPWASVSTALFE